MRDSFEIAFSLGSPNFFLVCICRKVTVASLAGQGSLYILANTDLPQTVYSEVAEQVGMKNVSFHMVIIP